MEILTDIARWLGLGLLAYFIGAIPTAYLFARFALGRDIRSIGDNNSGAANVFREIGPRAGLACGALDIIKGGVAVILVSVIDGDIGTEMLAGVFALVGHVWPVFLRLSRRTGRRRCRGSADCQLPDNCPALGRSVAGRPLSHAQGDGPAGYVFGRSSHTDLDRGHHRGLHSRRGGLRAGHPGAGRPEPLLLHVSAAPAAGRRIPIEVTQLNYPGQFDS